MNTTDITISFLLRSGKSADIRTVSYIKEFISSLSRKGIRISDIRMIAETSFRSRVFSDDFLESVHRAGFRTGAALPFTVKENDKLNFKNLHNDAGFEPDVLLHRNPASFVQSKQGSETDAESLADYSWNIANEYSSEYYKNKGIRRFSWAYELPFESRIELIRASDPEIWEAVLYSYIPGFYSDYCFFASFIGNASGPKDCNEECLSHTLQLKDRKGALHTAAADIFCRNTVYLEKPDDRRKQAVSYRREGIRHFRFEFLNESPEDILNIIKKTEI